MTQQSVFRIEIFPRQPINSTDENKWVTTAHQLGFTTLTGCQNARLFFVRGNLQLDDVERISRELLADLVTEQYTIGTADIRADHTVDVTYLPGVTDPVADNLVRAARQISVEGIQQAATGQRFHLFGSLSENELQTLAERVFANTVIQRTRIDQPIDAPFVEGHASDGLVETIALTEAEDNDLLAISKERRLSLDLNEMRAIQIYYRGEGREPTDVELETLAQTWSEHCVHKTFKAKIDFTGPDNETEIIDGILNTYIRAATEKVNKPWVRSAFVDNAGIIAFNNQHDLAFKVETHNHPSALEPFGGANTGVGGVVRDILGVSAKPIANTDVLCFGPQDLPDGDLLEGVLHPRRVQDGVVHGIEDYGNKMGIPTVNGAVVYDKGYTANPLVFCGCLGILPRESHPTEPQAGDLIVVLGGRTGRDGLRGATFSSMEMDTSTSDIASVSVQIGNPITEKQVQEVVVRARDEGLYNAITDCGAGGLSSAVGEMGADLGAEVELTTVRLKYAGLRPWEIWLSEAQERMVMAVPPDKWPRLQEIAAGQDVEAVTIGTYQPTGKLNIAYEGQPVGQLDMAFLHDGIPQRHLKAIWNGPETQAPSAQNVNIRETLLKLLAHPNIRSKEDIVRRYDHEVQGGTAVKPFGGKNNAGPNDGAVIVPVETQGDSEGQVKGVALSVGICPQYGKQDPYAMAWAAVDEAFRNLVAIGADPDQVALLDNFCWGNPNMPDRLGSLVLAAKGCHDAAVAYNAPFISGKDSLNNEYADADGTRHAIPGTLLISAVGIVPDVTKTVTMDLKQPGHLLYMIGELQDSHIPQPNENALETMRVLHQAIQAGLIIACHDVSEGGIAVALAEMCIAGGLGAKINAEMDDMIFAECNTGFIVEVSPEHDQAFRTLCEQVTKTRLGVVKASLELKIGSNLFSLAELEQAWRGAVSTDPAPDNIPQPEAPDPYQTAQMHRPSSRIGPARVMILHANGTNRDHDAALACHLAGGEPEIVHINQLISGERKLTNYHMLVLPGGFSYGDDLGAGVLWAQDLRYRLYDALAEFVVKGRPMLGICNGFQTLVKAGLLPDGDFTPGDERKVTLTYNQRNLFECRWLYLKPNPASNNLFTQGLTELIYCPVAHGEGRVVARDAAALDKLWKNGNIALSYVDADGQPVGYPGNPNGSDHNIAGLSSSMGNVFGLMPHPENHIFPWQHPRHHRGESGQMGLALFKNGLKYA